MIEADRVKTWSKAEMHLGDSGQCQRQRYLVFAQGIRAFKRTETEQIFVLEDAHSPSICPLLQVHTSLREAAPQAPDQPLSGTWSGGTTQVSKAAAPPHRHRGCTSVLPNTCGPQGLGSAWAGSPPTTPAPWSKLAPVGSQAGSQALWAGPPTRLDMTLWVHTQCFSLRLMSIYPCHKLSPTSPEGFQAGDPGRSWLPQE